MSRTLHWSVLSGCVFLITLFLPMAWQSLSVFRLPLGGGFPIGSIDELAEGPADQRTDVAELGGETELVVQLP